MRSRVGERVRGGGTGDTDDDHPRCDRRPDAGDGVLDRRTLGGIAAQATGSSRIGLRVRLSSLHVLGRYDG